MAPQARANPARRGLLACAASLAVASPAWANAGSALAASECCHLFFANIVIGIVEACVLLALYRARFVKACFLMVAANYVSMFAGVALQGLGLGLLDTYLARAPLYHVGSALVALVLGSYLVTIALEWPFCRWALGWRDTPFAKSFVAAVVTSGITYLLLALVYLPSTDISLLTRTHVDRDLVRGSPDDATIYFAGEDDYLWSVRISGNELRRVSERPVPQAESAASAFPDHSQLVLRPTDDGVDLCVGEADESEESWRAYRLPVLVENLMPVLPMTGDPTRHATRDRSMHVISIPLWGQAAYWDVSARQRHGVLAGGLNLKLNVSDETTGRRSSIALVAGRAFAWPALSPWVLSGDRVVYQLGEQIVLLDLTTMRIGHIVNGRDPIVVPDVIDVEALEGVR